MRAARYWTLLFALYLAADFLDPSIPGVFCFANEALFVDGVVQCKGEGVSVGAPDEPTPPLGFANDIIGSLGFLTPVLARPANPSKPLRRSQFLRKSPTVVDPALSAEDH